MQRLVESEVMQVNLGLKVIVHPAKSAGLNLAALIKPIFDGVMAAFHRHDGSSMDLVTKRLAGDLRIEPEKVAALLGGKEMAVLGTRKLIWPWRNGVQWNLSDDLLVAGELLVADDSPTGQWKLSGELFEVRQTG